MSDEYELQLNHQKQVTPTDLEGNHFPKISEFLSDEAMENKNLIQEVLDSDENLKKLFEEFLNSPDKTSKIRLCKRELKRSQTKDEIKSIIVENIPGGYKIGGPKKVNEGDIDETNDRNLEKAEQARTDTEQAEKDIGQAEKDIGQAEKDIDNQEVIENMKNAIKERDILLEKYGGLKEKTDKGSDLYNAVESNLRRSGKLSQLEEIGKGINDSGFVEKYILVQTTLQELKSNPTNYEQSDISFFDKVVKNLENSCKIPDTSLSSFNEKNIAQTRTELFHEEVGNEGLKMVRDDNMEIHKDEYEKLFQMKEEDMITKYGKFLEGKLKDFWNQYQNNSEIKDKFTNFKENHNLMDSEGKLLPYDKIKDNPNLTEEDKKWLGIYDKMRSAINIIKKNTDTKTIKMAEELRIISQIKGMYMCVGEGDDFDLNKAKEIESKKINGKNFLTLRGHIDGIDFTIRQDIDNPQARLQTSQKLAKSEDGKIFSIDGEDNFVDSNFILPSQDEIFGSIKETIQSDKSLENSDNSEKYLENLQANIMGKMEEKYENTKYVHHYMKEQVKGEKIVNKTLGTIREICPNIANNENLYKSINQASNKDLYDFIKILKFNIDNSTDVEKDKLNKCITRILEITDTYKNNDGIEDFVTLKYPPVIENYLKDKAWLNGGDEDSRLKSLSDLFRYYSEKSKDTRANSEGIVGTPSKMIINDLYVDLFEFQGGQSETASTRDMSQSNKFTLQSNEEEVKKESNNADLELDKSLDSGIWGS